MNNIIRKEMDFLGRKLVLETGKYAPQANRSVLATYGDTVVLVAVVAAAPKQEVDFLPLTVRYEEKYYAGGLIKTSRWVKREGAPTDQATIAGRLIDHAIRPLFPKDYQDEVNVTATVLSLDKTADAEVLAMIATSAALHSSDIPWKGPMVSARIGTDAEGKFVLNPTHEDLEKSKLDLMVSLVRGKFLALEAEAHILPEETIVNAVNFANEHTQDLAKFIDDFATEVGNEKYVYVSKKLPEELVNDVRNLAGDRVKELMNQNLEKVAMQEARRVILESVYVGLEGKYTKLDMQRAFEKLETDAMRDLVLKEHKRADGRGLEDLRDIEIDLGVLPRTHGSAYFARGITQTLTVATLGSASLEQLIQSMYGEETKRYIHHYNFPQYSVGEVFRGRSGPGGREIGHGMLAEKALLPVLPSREDFPYTIRLVSETLSSSGSSSMAATCGSSLALMDAGVPIKSHVAGIAVGIMANEDESEFVLITDMGYKEDAFGFMDFKMTGTRDGVTAIQVDIKLAGVPLELLPKIVDQSRRARLKILDVMERAISHSRSELSTFAPRMVTVQVKPDQVGLVIGSGGKTIREIESKSGATLGIEDSGLISITGQDVDSVEKAKAMIEGLVKQVEPGEVYEGIVKRIVDFGAFVEILPGKEGLLHVSELSYDYVKSVTDVLKEGDSVTVKVLEVDHMGKISLSKKALEEKPEGYEEKPRDRGGRDNRSGGRSGGFRGGDRKRY